MIGVVSNKIVWFEKITIKAEWGDIRCPKCGDKSKVDKKCKLAPGSYLKNI
jgi:hypothetical protein